MHALRRGRATTQNDVTMSIGWFIGVGQLVGLSIFMVSLLVIETSMY